MVKETKREYHERFARAYLANVTDNTPLEKASIMAQLSLAHTALAAYLLEVHK